MFTEKTIVKLSAFRSCLVLLQGIVITTAVQCAFAREELVLDDGKGPIAPLCLKYSPDGDRLLVVGSRCQIWDMSKVKPTVSELSVSGFGITGAFSPNGAFIAVLSVRKSENGFDRPIVSIFDSTSLKLRGVLESLREKGDVAINTLALSWFSDNRTLVTSTNEVILWNAKSLARKSTLESPYRNVVLRDDRTVLGIDESGKKICKSNCLECAPYYEHSRVINDLANSTDGKLLAFADDQHCYILDEHKKVTLKTPDAVSTMDFSSDHMTLAVGIKSVPENKVGTIELWNLQSKERRQRIKLSAPLLLTSVVLSPNGKEIAFAGGSAFSAEIDGFIGGVTVCPLDAD